MANSTADQTTTPEGKESWLSVYLRPATITLFFMGFSSGLPLPLVFGTLSAWLSEEGVTKTSIGFFAWIGFAYSSKFVWAPFIDRTSLPLIAKLMGRLRSWMLLAQISIFFSLLAMSMMSPKDSLWLFALIAAVVAFASATQDITVDAYRIQIMTAENRGPISATYMFGYRLALLLGGALALIFSDFLPWSTVYMLMALLMAIGVITTLVVKEPVRVMSQVTLQLEADAVRLIARVAHLPAKLRAVSEWFIRAVICPFIEFFSRYQLRSLVILLLILLYGISDRALITIANPFYLDMGFTKTQIGVVAKFFGFFMTITGTITGGYLIYKIGVMRSLLIGAILVASTNLMFALLSQFPTLTMLTVVISADNFSGGLASAAFVAYLSSLTSTSYSATQYALFSSLMTILGTFLAGFSGVIIDAKGYVFFFSYVASIGIPAIILIMILMKIANIDKENPLNTIKSAP